MFHAGCTRHPWWHQGAAGFTLIELLLVMVLSAVLMTVAVMPILTALGASRLESSLQNLVAALNFSRSEMLRSGRAVKLCGLHMRRNQTKNGCRAHHHSAPWNQGVLVYADHLASSKDGFDSGEDLRQYGFSSSVAVSSSEAAYLIMPGTSSSSSFLPVLPMFVLVERVSRQCATVQMVSDLAWPEICRGAACPRCQ